MPKDVIEQYTTKRAAQLAGLSTAMVDYLCRMDLLVPSLLASPGHGRARLYSFGDVVILRALSQLLANGISVFRLKQGLKNLRKRHPKITRDAVPTALLVTDGKTLLLRERSDVVEDLNKGQLAFGFVLELGAVHKEVAKTANRQTKFVKGIRRSAA